MRSINGGFERGLLCFCCNRNCLSYFANKLIWMGTLNYDFRDNQLGAFNRFLQANIPDEALNLCLPLPSSGSVRIRRESVFYSVDLNSPTIFTRKVHDLLMFLQVTGFHNLKHASERNVSQLLTSPPWKWNASCVIGVNWIAGPLCQSLPLCYGGLMANPSKM